MATQTPLMVITDVGLEAANVATPTGPWINLAEFRIGSDYGYQADKTDTGMRGSTLYVGQPTSYRNVGNGVLDVICRLDPAAGPFDFGEVSLWLPNNVMFAKAVFDQPQSKFSVLENNIAATFTFHCLLKLQQGVSIFQINAICEPDIWEVDLWSDVYPPMQMPNPDVPVVLVREGGTTGMSSQLQKLGPIADNVGWAPATGYSTPFAFAPVAASAATWIEFAGGGVLKPIITTLPSKEFLIRVNNAAGPEFRAVTSVVQNGANYRFNLAGLPLRTVPAAGVTCDIFRDSYDTRIFYSQIIDPPVIGAGAGLYTDGQGRLAARGLLHGPEAQGTGHLLTSAENFDNPNMPSGIYMVTSGGNPAGTRPDGGDALIQHINDFESGYQIVIQTWIPTENVASGNVTTPMFYRGYRFLQGNWSPWYAISARGKAGGGTFSNRGVQSSGWTELNDTGSLCFYMIQGGNNDGAGGNAANRYDLNALVDGNGIASCSDANDSWRKEGCLTVPVPAGSTLQVTSNPFAAGAGQFTVVRFQM